jgi:hypothetical protein
MARAAIVAGLAGHVAEAVLADALLVVAELVTNSVRHADADGDAAITVRAELRPDVLHVAVADRGRGGSVTRRAPDLERGGGFGLVIVEKLSQRWGVDGAGGTRVWAELACAQSTNGHPAIEGGTVGEHSRLDGARGPDTTAPVRARADAAVRQAAVVCAAAAHAQDNARRACARRAQLRAWGAGTAGSAFAFDNGARPRAASPIVAPAD